MKQRDRTRVGALRMLDAALKNGRDRGWEAAHRTGRADDPQAPAQAARGVGRSVPQSRTGGAGRSRVGRGRDRPLLPPRAALAEELEEIVDRAIQGTSATRA